MLVQQPLQLIIQNPAVVVGVDQTLRITVGMTVSFSLPKIWGEDKLQPFLSILGELPPVRIEISESGQSLSVNLQVTHGALSDAHYLFYDFASHEEFASQFPEPTTLDETARVNTLYHEHVEKRGMQTARWIGRREIIEIGKAIAEVGHE